MRTEIKPDQNFIIKGDAVIAFLKYLGSKPHDEVELAINVLRNLEEHKPKEKSE